MKKLFTNLSSTAAETPQPANPLTPQAVIDQLRAIRTQIAEVTPLTADQRKAVRNLAQTVTNEILQASITVIDSADLVSQAVGQQPEDVRALYDESNRWRGVEAELQSMLQGVAGANLIRQQRLALIVRRAYGVGAQLATDPSHAAVLLPQVTEIKRLKRLARGKKHKPAEEPPSPTPATPQSETK